MEIKERSTGGKQPKSSSDRVEMKSLLCLALVPLVLAAVVPAPAEVKPEEPKVEVAKKELPMAAAKDIYDAVRAHNRKAAKPGWGHFLCSPCQTVFDDVLDELEKEEEITEPLLQSALDNACDKWIIEEEEQVDSKRVCTYLHVC
ncbi:hypothetical protein M3Y99_01500100 [Aphelenchoides fujianensis]|nr:hypothetical protein M3Y99_01500100 [Aphelenchoides fujianensis]